MRAALEEAHVGLHWFLPRAEFTRRFDAVVADAAQPMTARAFHRRLLPLVAALRHGRTTLELPVAAETFRLQQLRLGGRYFPFAVRVIDGRVYVATDMSDEGGVGAGAEILAVDGRPAAALVDTMRTYLSADGANDTYKAYQIGDGYRFLDLLDLLYGPAVAYQVDLRPAPAGPQAPPPAAVRRTVAALSPGRLAERYRERMGRSIDAQPPAVDFALLGHGAARLTVRSFHRGLLRGGSPGFDAEFDVAFRRLTDAGVTDLIVDVRGNEGGGGEVAPELYRFVADGLYKLARPTMMAWGALAALLNAEGSSDTARTPAAGPGEFLKRAPDGSWMLKDVHDPRRHITYSPDPAAFAGRLYVLVDGGTSGEAGDYLDLVWRYHRGAGRFVRFVGEPNGGDNAYGRVSGGRTRDVVLPHSGQRLTIPILGFTRHFSTAAPNAVIPDHRVRPSAWDLAAGVDRELEFTRALIAEARRRDSTTRVARGGAGARDAGRPPGLTPTPHPALDRAVRAAAAAGFAGTVLVADARRVLYARAVGLADRAAQRPHALDETWRWASVTEQVTAVLVMQQVEAGRLLLDETLADALPGFAGPTARQVTIRHLLQHTSGLPNPDDTPKDAAGVPAFYQPVAFTAQGVPADVVTAESEPPDVSAPAPLAPPAPTANASAAAGYCARSGARRPGARVADNSCDYLVLGAVLEHVTGRPYAELVDRQLARPLGLTSLRVQRPAGWGAGATVGYLAAGAPEPAFDLGAYGAAGALHGTPADLLAFNRALLAGPLLEPASRAALWAGDPALGGAALGGRAFRAALAGCAAPVRLVERRGAVGGVQVRNVLAPERGVSVVVFANTARPDLGEARRGRGLTHALVRAALCASRDA